MDLILKSKTAYVGDLYVTDLGITGLPKIVVEDSAYRSIGPDGGVGIGIRFSFGPVHLNVEISRANDVIRAGHAVGKPGKGRADEQSCTQKKR